MIDLTPIVTSVVVLIFALISAYLIPSLKVKFTSDKLDQIQTWVRIAVQAAEMIFHESGLGAAKKEYVIDFLEAKGFKLDLDELNALIESEVLKLQNTEK